MNCKFISRVYKNMDVVTSFGYIVRSNVDYSRGCDFEVCEIGCGDKDSKVKKRTIFTVQYEKD